MQFILPILYSLAFIFLICKINFFAVESLSRTKLVGLFVLKLIAGIAVWLVYSKHYSFSDFHIYFSDSSLLIEKFSGKNPSHPLQNWDAMFENTLFNNSRTMIVLNVLLQLFSFGNFYVHIVFFCFFSFIGLTAVFKAFVFHFPSKVNQLVISIFFVPSILFWSSAPLKESVVICLVGLIVYLTDFGLKRNYTFKAGIIIFLLLLVVVFVKIYVAIALIPVLLSNLLIAKTSAKKIILKYISIFSIVFFLCFIIKIIQPDYNVLQLIADKQAKAISEAKGGVFLVNDKKFISVDYYKSNDILIPQPDSSYKIKKGSEYLCWKQNDMADTEFVKNADDTAKFIKYYSVVPANTVSEVRPMKANLVDFIMYCPLAIINVLFQPTIFNIKSWLHLVVAVENMWLILIILLAIIFHDKTILQKKEMVLFCFIFAFLLFALIGITVPVIGSMVRYRIVGLLFFVPIILMMIDEKKLRNIFESKVKKSNVQG